MTLVSLEYFSLVTEMRSAVGALRLSDWFNRPGIIELGDNFDSLSRGHATQPEQLTDNNIDPEVNVIVHIDLIAMVVATVLRTLTCISIVLHHLYYLYSRSSISY